MALGELIVRLSADVAQFQSDMGRALHIANRQGAAISRSIGQINNAFSALGGIAAGALGTFSVSRMIAAATEAEQASTRLSSVLEATGYSAGIAKKELDDLAESMSRTTTFDDESLRSAEATFLKFGNIQEDVFRRAMKAAADYASFAGTNVSEAAQTLGKALQSPAEGTMMLERNLGKLTWSQKENIKVLMEQGKLLEAQAAVLAIVEGRVGGTAEKMNTGLTKVTRDTSKAFGELLETFGKTSLVIRPMEGLASLMYDLKATIEGTRNPLSDLVLKFADMADRAPLLLKLIAGLPQLSAMARSAVTTSAVTGVIRRPDQERDKLAGAASVGRLQAVLDAAQEKAAADAKKAAEEGKKAGADAQRAAEQAAVAKIRLLDQLANAEVSAIKDSATRQEAILDAQHQAGLLSEMAYWTQKGEIQKAAQDAALNAMNAQIERQVALVLAQKNGTKEYFDALGDLEKSLEQRNKLEADGEQAVKMLGMSAERAAKSWNKEVEDLNIQLMELKGNSIGAAQARFNAQTSGLRERSVVNKRPDVTASIDEARNLNQLQLQFNESREQLAEINARLQIDEDRIRNSGLGELQVMGKTDAARQSAVERLKEVVAEMQRIAELAKNPALVLQADQAAAALENLGARANEVGETYGAMFKDNFANAFADFISGSKSAKDAFKDFANNIVKELTRMQSQALATNIWNVINGKGEKGQAGGGAGGIVDKLMGLLKGGGGTQVNAAGTNKESATKDETLAFWGPGSDLAKATEAQVLGAEEVTDSFAKIGAQSIESIAKSLLVETSMTTLSSTALSSAAESMAASLLVETSMTTLSAAALQAAAALKAISASEAVESDGGSGIGSMLKGLFGGGGGGGELASVGATQLLGGFASGTEYVPKTGPYMLHQGERVVQESENRGGGSVQVTLNVGSLDPSMAAGVIMKNEALILGLFRRAYNQRGVTTPIG